MNKGVKIKFETLKSSLDFKNLHKGGRHIDNFYFKLVINLIDGLNNRVRVGYNINKKIARSSVRNLIKRRVREIFRGLQKNNTVSLDILFIAKKSIVNSGFALLKDHISSYMNEYLS